MTSVPASNSPLFLATKTVAPNNLIIKWCVLENVNTQFMKLPEFSKDS